MAIGPTAYLRHVGHGLQLLLPELGDLDGLLLGIDAVGGHPLLVGMLHDLCQIFRMEGVQDVEEVVPWRTLAFRKCGWKERQKFRIFLELWPEILHAQLVVLRDLDESDL